MRSLGLLLLLVLGAPATISFAMIPLLERDPVIERYKAALAKNDIDLAVSIVCDAAKADPKKYEKRCTNAQQDANKQLQRLDATFNTGKSELESKDYAGAARDLEKVTYGPHKDEAQALLRQANEGLGHPQMLATDKVTLGVAQAAYARGDLSAAKQSASEIKVVELKPLAQQMLTNIHSYEEAIKQGDAAMQAHNFSAAQQQYKFAIAINAKGPGSPSDKLQQATVQATAPKTNTKVETVTNGAAKAGTTDQKKPDLPVPNDNSDRLKAALNDAHTAEANKNIDAALAAYDRAIALNPRLPEAIEGKQRVLDSLKANVQTLESKLAGGIRSYYKSHFAESAAELSLYLKSSGTRNKGAAYFYLGATFANEALLSDEKADPESKALRERAKEQFQMARREHYQPIQRYISPRVLALWNESPG